MRKPCAALLAAAFLLCGCLSAPQPASSQQALRPVGGSTTRSAVSSSELQFENPGESAVFTVMQTSLGEVRFVLYPALAPIAVENFCALALGGYYNETVIHRVVPGFIIQGGDATGTGLSGYSIWQRTFATERSEKLHHYSGALCMAAANGRPNTHQSQFYVVATPQNSLTDEDLLALEEAGLRQGIVDTYRQAGGAPYLDNTATVFGQVVSGMDVIDKIAAVSTDENSRPKSDVRVETVSIENYTPQSGVQHEGFDVTAS